MNLQRLRRWAAVGVLASANVIGGAGGAGAATITQTLVSGNGVVGGLDAKVQYFDGSTWQPAAIISADPAWSTIPGTQWVNWAAGEAGKAVNTVRYRISFELPAGATAPSLSVELHADNAATLYLNGTHFGMHAQADTPAHYTDPPELFNATSGFVPGTNVLEIDNRNFVDVAGIDFKAILTYTEGTDLDGDGIADTAPPTNADQCKNDGWRSFNNPTFKNQGDCVSFVATKATNPAGG